jgi:hypothetical protein
MSLLDSVRSILIEMKKTNAVFHPAELQNFAFANSRKFKIPAITFEYGSAFPYSQRLEDAISFLVLNGEVEVSPNNSCELVISDKLKNIAGSEAAGAAIR